RSSSGPSALDCNRTIGTPRPRVLGVRAFVEGQRLDAEVQGGDVAAAVAAEHDGRGARPGPGQVDAEGIGILAVGVEAKSPAHRGHRDLPADDEVVMADGDLDTAEHPGLGSVSTPGPREYQPHSSPQARGCSGTPVRTASPGRPRTPRRTALAA